MKPRKHLFVFFIFSLGAIQNAPSQPNDACLHSFREQIAGKDYLQQFEVVKSLKKAEMACLFYATQNEPLLEPDFLIDSENPQKVQKFYGKNSLILFNQFEKHFFSVDSAGSEKVYGYNLFLVGKIFRSYGFFYADAGQRPEELVLEYDLDFPELIPQERWDTLGNRAGSVKKIKGNRGDLIFDRIKDILHPVAENVAVGRAVRVRNGKEQHLTYFVILRVP
ncbi:MAG: hypothetical protein HY538_02910 [Deltaproteobacteria bacterium]|nr:hypothetical protein [Deltaproteobacteria bacterium]